MDKSNAVVAAIKAMKAGQFKLTAIKVELEAQFDREGGEDCDECDEGRVECSDCYGEGSFSCDTCSGAGTVDADEDERECEDCAAEGYITCTECQGEGYFDCGFCDGNYQGNGSEFGDEDTCHDFIMERLANLGLAERVDPYRGWVVKAPLKYAQFYRDGSVDSEFTFTLSVKNPKSVLLLPKIIEIWNELGDAIGNGMHVDGAGMHMALLNDKKCIYPTGTSTEHIRRFENFSRSMRMLLPALYFLGTSCENSRGMSYRRPEVAMDTHRAAIDFRGGALEFRIFDTCYDQPEAILDNLVVMKNCMRYWTSKYKPSGLGKIVKEVSFGNDHGYKLDRLYARAEHIDLLNAGLRKLKPSYYSISDLKQQRKFGVNKRVLNVKLKDEERQAAASYKEYEDRFEWDIKRWRHQFMADHMSARRAPSVEEAERYMAEIEAMAEESLQNQLGKKRSPKQHIEQAILDYHERNRGRWTLSESEAL